MNLELLNDRWHTRDFPILLAAARAAEAGQELLVDPLADELQIRFRDVLSAMEDLEGTYLDARFTHDEGGAFHHIRLTDQGRRAVGLWPSTDTAATALEDALREAEAATDDPEEKSRIRRALTAVGSLSRGVAIDVVGAVVAKQSGLG